MIPSTSEPITDRALINRANAQHSTGPKTEEGKQRSSLNALRHGLTGQTIVLPSDDLAAYQRHIQSYVTEYKPKGPTETQLVQTLADTAWRLNRVSALENNLLTLGIVNNLNAEPDPVQDALSIVRALDSQTRVLANLSLHGQRLSRQFEKTHALLKQIQSERIPNDEYDLRQAADLVYMHELKRKSYDPAEDGFVFSDEEIQATIHRCDRDVRAGNAAVYIAKSRRRR
jgi:hypothetical protein